MADRSPRVALLIETSREYGRGLLRGVMRYLDGHGPWSLDFRPAGLAELPPTWLGGWDGDGVLVRADSRRFIEAIRASGLPAVELRLRIRDSGLPAVGIDSRAVAELAFGHLRDRGFRNFAFCGLPAGDNYWADFRGECFAGFAAAAGCPCHLFAARRPARRAGGWEAELLQIAEWLASLPKPIGVMAWHDDRGRQVLEACRLAGLAVPDEVAVIGVDNDEFLCNLSTPPLSSVNVGVDRVGYEAAVLLDRMMASARADGSGRRRAPVRAARGEVPRPLLLPPLGVVVRRSTDVVAIEDRELADRIRFIREHACEGLRVEDVFEGTESSYSTLKRRFKALLGRTPKQEITRIRIERARQMLTATDLPAGEVAAKCGFSELKRFSEVFRAETGTTPGAYRRKQRSAE